MVMGGGASIDGIISNAFTCGVVFNAVSLLFIEVDQVLSSFFAGEGKGGRSGGGGVESLGW